MPDEKAAADAFKPDLWVHNRVYNIFGFPKAKQDKAMAALDDDTKNEVKAFCDKEEYQFLTFSSGAEGVWTAVAELPDLSKLKKKVLFVHKVGAGKITKENLFDKVIFMEATKDVMGMLNTYCHSVYLSTLSNPANQTGWSDLLSKDLMDKYHVFLANLHVTCGLMVGKTLLPLPPKEATNERASASSKDRVHVLESAVITWTKQISNVLKQDPEALLKKGNPGPNVELEFWRSKAANLNVIHAQLQSEQLKKVLKFLEQNKSTYTNPFSRLQKEVEQARDEAIDNDHFLKTLLPFFEVLTNDGADYEKLPNCFDGLLHTILLVWKYSKYYNTPGRLVVLIREVCNVIINQSIKYINGPQIFTLIQNEEAKEAVDKLERTLAICTEFKDRYAMYKDIAEQQPNGGWSIGKSLSGYLVRKRK